MLRAITFNGIPITPSSISLPSGGSFDLYNTADQTTNYERLRADWSGNVARITTQQGGTGVVRNLTIGAAAALTVYGGSTGTSMTLASSTASSTLASFTTTGASASSGTQTIFGITPVLNQSSTAGATILNVDPTVSATGSGSYLAQRWGWNGTEIGRFSSAGTLYAGSLASLNVIGFSTSYGGTVDVQLARDAADTLALRRSTNAQTFRVYKTYTDASNYERLDIGWSGSQCFIGAAYAGTGSGRELQFVSYGSAAFTLTATAHMALAAGTTARSQINFASSTAPTSPADGDLWFDGTNLKLRVSGTTYTLTKV